MKRAEEAKAIYSQSTSQHRIHWGWIFFSFLQRKSNFLGCHSNFRNAKPNITGIILSMMIGLLFCCFSLFFFCRAFRWRATTTTFIWYTQIQTCMHHTYHFCGRNFFFSTKVHFRFLFIKVNFYAISNICQIRVWVWVVFHLLCVCVCVRYIDVLRYDEICCQKFHFRREVHSFIQLYLEFCKIILHILL